MKRMKKLLGILLALTLALSMFALPAMAEEQNTPQTTTTGTEHKYKYNDEVAGSDAYLKAVKGTTFKFKKFLVIPAGVEVPNAEFKFTIESTDSMNYTDTTMAIYSTKPIDGYVSGEPSFEKNKAKFAPGDTTYNTVRKNGTVDMDIDVKREAVDRGKSLTKETGVEWESGKEVYAVFEDLEIDFSGVTFNEPGIYRYIIRESSNSTDEDAGIMHDNQTFRVLDVYVTDTDNKPTTTSHSEGELHLGLYQDQYTSQNTITGYVLHKGLGTPGDWKEDGTVASNADKGSGDVSDHGVALGDKTDGFTNEYKPYDLLIAKQVKGNQASRDKYFEFTVTVTGLKTDDKFIVSISDDSNANTTDGYANAKTGSNAATIAANSDKNNETEVTGGELSSGVKFYLQHEQCIAIRGLPANAVYTVEENAEDYKSEGAKAELTRVTNVKGKYMNATSGTISEVDKVDRDGTTSKFSTENDARDHKVYTSFLNTREGIIPTGIITVIGPAVALILLAVVGLIVVFVGKNRKKSGAR